MITAKPYLFFAFLFSFSSIQLLHAQDRNDSTAIDISKVALTLELKPFVQTAFQKKGTNLQQDLADLDFRKGTYFNGPVPNNFVTRIAVMRFRLCNRSDSTCSVYFFPGFYVPTVRLFRLEGNLPVPLQTTQNDEPQHLSFRKLTLNAHDTLTVVAELGFLRTYSNKLRPRLINPAYLESFIFNVRNINSESDMTTYVFCGLLLMMILYSLASFFQGGNREFLYYSLYAILLGSMLLTKAIWNYHADRLNFFLEEYLDFILQCLGIIFYMLFMQRFLETRSSYRFLYKLYGGGVVLLVTAISLYTFFHYATDNFPAENLTENLTKFLLLAMVVVFLVYAARHWQNRLLRYLFWGNMLFLAFSVFSFLLIIAPHTIHFSGLAGNSLVYYEAGLFFELVFFLAALNHKNRRRIVQETKEIERLKAQNLVKEYEKEMAVYKAQQEERERISADMHDELGSGMTAIRLMSEIARNKMKEQTPVEIEKISQSADDVLNKMNAIIWSMNSSNDTLDNLLLYIRAYAIEYFDNTPVTCNVIAPEYVKPVEITGEKRRNIFLSVKETLNNVLKHAQATEVNISINVNHHITIRIADNGRGTDIENLRRFGNGLKNISRRMEIIGGSFNLENDNGTVATLTLPL